MTLPRLIFHFSRLPMFRTILFGGVCIAILLAFDHHAHADYENAALVDGTLTPTNLSAVGNSQTYTQVSWDRAMSAKILVKADTGVFGRITEVHAYLNLTNLDWDTHNLSGYNWGYHKSYRGGKPRSIDSTVSVRIPTQKLFPWMIAQCNGLVHRLQRQGMSDREIWGQDRRIKIMAGAAYAVGFTAPRGSHSPEIKPKVHNVTLTCRKFAGAQGPGVTGLGSQETIVRVENARLEHSTVAGHSGVCRLNLNYAVRTNHKNVVVKFRLKDDKGRSSEVKTLTTNDQKIATGSVSYDIPNNVGAEIGKIRMHGVSPEFLSNRIEYRVVCHTPPAGGLTSGQGAGGQTIQRDRLSDPAKRDRLRQNRSSQGRQRIGGGMHSRGIGNLPPPVNPDPEPPALPAP